MATTFSFGGVDIHSVVPPGADLVIRNIQRPVRLPKTVHKVKIPGMAGSYDFGGGVVEDYEVVVTLVVAGTFENIREATLAIGDLLEGKEDLVFSDMPGEVHLAEINQGIQDEPEGVGNASRLLLRFECDAS